MNSLRRSLSKAAAITRAPASFQTRSMAGLPTPKFFGYDTVKANLSVGQAFKAVEEAFAMLADDKVGR